MINDEIFSRVGSRIDARRLLGVNENGKYYKGIHIN